MTTFAKPGKDVQTWKEWGGGGQLANVERSKMRDKSPCCNRV